MAGSKEQATEKELKALFKKWDNYVVICSKPDAKGVRVFRIMRQTVQIWWTGTKNYDLKRLMTAPGFHPDHLAQVKGGVSYGMFDDVPAGDIDHYLILRKAEDHLREGEELTILGAGFLPLKNNALRRIREARSNYQQKRRKR